MDTKTKFKLFNSQDNKFLTRKISAFWFFQSKINPMRLIIGLLTFEVDIE
jgi:hypothetical protein